MSLIQYAEDGRDIPLAFTAVDGAFIVNTSPDTNYSTSAASLEVKGHIMDKLQVTFTATGPYIAIASTNTISKALFELPTVWSLSKQQPLLVTMDTDGQSTPGLFFSGSVGNSVGANVYMGASLKISAITSSWDANTVTWNTAPPTRQLATYGCFISAIGVHFEELTHRSISYYDPTPEQVFEVAPVTLSTWDGVPTGSIYGVQAEWTSPSMPDKSDRDIWWGYTALLGCKIRRSTTVHPTALTYRHPARRLIPSVSADQL